MNSDLAELVFFTLRQTVMRSARLAMFTPITRARAKPKPGWWLPKEDVTSKKSDSFLMKFFLKIIVMAVIIEVLLNIFTNVIRVQ